MSSDDSSKAASLLRHLVASIVDKPDEVVIDTTEDDEGALQFDVRVGDGDMGRVIGKRGRTAHAIRALIRAAAAKDGTSVNVEFID